MLGEGTAHYEWGQTRLQRMKLQQVEAVDTRKHFRELITYLLLLCLQEHDFGVMLRSDTTLGFDSSIPPCTTSGYQTEVAWLASTGTC